ncbi:MAG: four helix bundle protein [Chloroflexota bacterium]
MSSRFEDNIAWQKARILTRDIYAVTRQPDFARDFGLAGQIQRASVSIMSNIAEGYERTNPGDYHRFLQIAKASCGEVRSQLYVALDINYITQEQFKDLHTKAIEISRIIAGIMKTVNKKREK